LKKIILNTKNKIVRWAGRNLTFSPKALSPKAISFLCNQLPDLLSVSRCFFMQAADSSLSGKQFDLGKEF